MQNERRLCLLGVRGVMCCFANHAPVCALTVRWRWLHCSHLSYVLKCMSICQIASSNWVPIVFLLSDTLYHQPWPRRNAESCGGVERILEPPKGLSILSFTPALVSPIPTHTDSHRRTFSTHSWNIMDKTQVNFKRENGLYSNHCFVWHRERGIKTNSWV